jgi:hypothetical protein
VPKEEYQWSVEIDAKPAIQTVIDTTRIDTPWVKFDGDAGNYASAAPTIRAIPDVVAAPPAFTGRPCSLPGPQHASTRPRRVIVRCRSGRAHRD